MQDSEAYLPIVFMLWSLGGSPDKYRRIIKYSHSPTALFTGKSAPPSTARAQPWPFPQRHHGGSIPGHTWIERFLCSLHVITAQQNRHVSSLDGPLGKKTQEQTDMSQCTEKTVPS